MEILLNPNVAYLLLVSGLLLAVLAVLAPGTGLLEIGAFFTLMLAGYGIYNLPINYWALGLVILGMVAFVLAVRRPRRLVFLVVSILALVVGSAFLFQGEDLQPAVNPVLALVTSTLTAGFLWIVFRKILETERLRPTHDLGALIGEVGEAKTDIQPEGTVQVAGELWSARSNTPIRADAPVRVVGRDGFILEVEPKDGHQPQT
jgi:membrane-bound serine protease (ClpP class)